MKIPSKPSDTTRRAITGAAEWSGSMVRGSAALDFLERSSDVASERVVAVPLRAPHDDGVAEADSA